MKIACVFFLFLGFAQNVPAQGQTGGKRYALLVGINRYANSRIPELQGALADVDLMTHLLSSENGYDFPLENIKVLTDEQASLAAFRSEFDALLTRAEKGDVVFIFFAGFGSQVADQSGDEADGLDETLLFHDSRTGDVPDLSDDAFNDMLARLAEKEVHLAVVLDTSAGQTRGTGSRFLSPDESITRARKNSARAGEGWIPGDLKNAVVFCAAVNGEPAFENETGGLFTRTLYQVWSQVGARAMTYTASAARIRYLVREPRPQLPYFEGAMDHVILQNRSRQRPLGWQILSPGDDVVQIGGPPLPGMGHHAELRVYDAAATAADFSDPAKAKALLVVIDYKDTQARARVDVMSSGLEVGDLAVLVRRGDDALLLRVRIRPHDQPGGIPIARAQRLREAAASNPEARGLIDMQPKRWDFELTRDRVGRIQLIGPEGKVRNVYESPPEEEARDVIANLCQFAAARGLMQLVGEGGIHYEDNKTLQVRVVPAGKNASWPEQEPNQLQSIPLGSFWQIEVTVSADSPTPLLVGGLLLSGTGDMLGFPQNGRLEPLVPGKTFTFSSRQDIFGAYPPLNEQEYILVFGTRPGNPVNWSLLSEGTRTRSNARGQGALFRALDRYLTPGKRAVRSTFNEDSPWTMTALPIRVVPMR